MYDSTWSAFLISFIENSTITVIDRTFKTALSELALKRFFMKLTLISLIFISLVIMFSLTVPQVGNSFSTNTQIILLTFIVVLLVAILCIMHRLYKYGMMHYIINSYYKEFSRVYKNYFGETEVIKEYTEIIMGSMIKALSKTITKPKFSITRIFVTNHGSGISKLA